MWNLLRDETNYGIAKRALTGHNHFVSDVVISSDGQFALSGSWDATLRLWDLNTGERHVLLLVQSPLRVCVCVWLLLMKVSLLGGLSDTLRMY